MEGDGNCLYRALRIGLSHHATDLNLDKETVDEPSYVLRLRAAALQVIAAQPTLLYPGGVDSSGRQLSAAELTAGAAEYAARMSARVRVNGKESYEWGGDVELVALARHFLVDIVVHAWYPDEGRRAHTVNCSTMGSDGLSVTAQPRATLNVFYNCTRVAGSGTHYWALIPRSAAEVKACSEAAAARVNAAAAAARLAATVAQGVAARAAATEAQRKLRGQLAPAPKPAAAVSGKRGQAEALAEAPRAAGELEVAPQAVGRPPKRSRGAVSHPAAPPLPAGNAADAALLSAGTSAEASTPPLAPGELPLAGPAAAGSATSRAGGAGAASVGQPGPVGGVPRADTARDGAHGSAAGVPPALATDVDAPADASEAGAKDGVAGAVRADVGAAVRAAQPDPALPAAARQRAAPAAQAQAGGAAGAGAAQRAPLQSAPGGASRGAARAGGAPGAGSGAGGLLAGARGATPAVGGASAQVAPPSRAGPNYAAAARADATATAPGARPGLSDAAQLHEAVSRYESLVNVANGTAMMIAISRFLQPGTAWPRRVGAQQPTPAHVWRAGKAESVPPSQLAKVVARELLCEGEAMAVWQAIVPGLRFLTKKDESKTQVISHLCHAGIAWMWVEGGVRTVAPEAAGAELLAALPADVRVHCERTARLLPPHPRVALGASITLKDVAGDTLYISEEYARQLLGAHLPADATPIPNARAPHRKEVTGFALTSAYKPGTVQLADGVVAHQSGGLTPPPDKLVAMARALVRARAERFAQFAAQRQTRGVTPGPSRTTVQRTSAAPAPVPGPAGPKATPEAGAPRRARGPRGKGARAARNLKRWEQRFGASAPGPLDGAPALTPAAHSSSASTVSVPAGAALARVRHRGRGGGCSAVSGGGDGGPCRWCRADCRRTRGAPGGRRCCQLEWSCGWRARGARGRRPLGGAQPARGQRWRGMRRWPWRGDADGH